MSCIALRPVLSLFVCTAALLGSSACSSELGDPASGPGQEQIEEVDAASSADAEPQPDAEFQPDAQAQDDAGSQLDAQVRPTPDSNDPELAYFEQRGEAVEVYFGGRQIIVEEVDGEHVFEGDILLPDQMVTIEEIVPVFESTEEAEAYQETHGLTARTQAHWPDGIVTYAIDPNLPDQQRVTDAIAHWEANTNIDFVERTDESNYVYFTPGSGCSSYVGQIGGEQNINLADACSTGNTIHEIGHAIGLWHEHSRADRDDYVTVHWDNIQTGRDYNFKTYVEAGWDGAEHTNALDFGSIMMYSPYSFSSNGQPTITKSDGTLYSVQRNGLSDDDIIGLELLYPANAGQPVYENGQFYTISGLTVYRYADAWFYYGNYGWREVRLYQGYWYWA